MKNSPYESLINVTNYCAVPIRLTVWLAALVLSLLGAATLQAQSISDNFNDQTDSGAQAMWMRYDLGYWTTVISEEHGISPPWVYGAATYSFPTNSFGPSGNYGYEIQAAPTWYAPTDGDPFPIGNARAASFVTNGADALFTNRFLARVDFLAWTNPPSWDQYAGLFCLVQPASIQPGQTAGYSITLNGKSPSEIDLSLVANEAPGTMGELDNVPLDPTHQYRMEVSSADGITFLAKLFDTSDTNNPWVSAIAADQTGSYTNNNPGYCGLIVFEDNYPSETDGAQATFDNYFSTTPAPGAMPATVTDLSPQPKGQPTAFYPTVTVGILNRDSNVDTTSTSGPHAIQLWQDGVQIPFGSLNISNYVYKPDNSGDTAGGTAILAFPGATIYWTNTSLLPPGSQHTNVVVYSDDVNVYSNAWTWTTAYPLLYASNSLPIGSLTLPGFDARMVQSSAANIAGSVSSSAPSIPNSVASAQAVLAYQYAVDLAATNIVQAVAWGLNAGQNGDEYGAITNFPGLCIPPANINSFAIQALTYLQLSAGLNRFYVDCDDTVGIFSGTNLTDTSKVLLETTGVAHQSFDFAVEADGLYPFNIIYEEGGGAAYLVLNSVNLTDNSQTLLNATGGVPAFYPLAWKSSTSVPGPYAVDGAANVKNVLAETPVSCDGTNVMALNQKVIGGILTVPVSGPTKFYRLDGPRPTKITNITNSLSGLVITYQAQ